jgi:hypothetical protein
VRVHQFYPSSPTGKLESIKILINDLILCLLREDGKTLMSRQRFLPFKLNSIKEMEKRQPIKRGAAGA